jgi:putative MATE family efflux protein
MKMQNKTVLDDDRIGLLLFKLSVPAFFGIFVITLYNIIDTVFIGRYVGSLGIAGLSIVFPLQMLSLGIGQLTGMGGASLMSRLIGEGNITRSQRALGNALISAIVLSIIMAIVGYINPDFWLRLMGASENVLPYARDYMQIILVGLIFQTVAMAMSFFIRAEGNAPVSMLGMIIGAVINIALDAVFIVALDMGIFGAALATVIAQVISVIYFMAYYFSGRSLLKIHAGDLVPEFNILKRIFAIGVSSLAMSLTVSLSAILVNRTLLGYGGDMAVSAYGVVNRIIMFAIMPGIVIGQGLQPILGFNYGAKRFDRALKVIKLALISASVFSVVVFIILYFFPDLFIRIFTTEEELIVLGAYAAKRVFLALYLVGFSITGSLIFQSIGKAVLSFVTSISRTVLFLIPLLLILPRFMQLDGVWLAFPLADALAFILVVILIIPQIRKFKQMSAEPQAEPAAEVISN